MELHQTRNDLASEVRTDIVTLLNHLLADILDLGMQAKYAHWNVKGPSFFSLHELFDAVAEQLETFSDEIAERAVALGGTAQGTIQTVSLSSRLPPYPPRTSAGMAHIAALADALAAFGTSVRLAIGTATEAGDADSADLCTGISRGIDKLLWLVEAHGQTA